MFIFSGGAFDRESCAGIYIDRKNRAGLVGDGVLTLEKYKTHHGVIADGLKILKFTPCEVYFAMCTLLNKLKVSDWTDKYGHIAMAFY